jgi:hypothetical protein
MKELIFALMLWIGGQTGFPIPRPPIISVVTPIEIRYFMYGCEELKKQNDPMYDTWCIVDRDDFLDPSAIDVIAVYDHETGTIYLPTYFDKNNNAHKAILLHELVHHLQYKSGYDKKVSCMPMLEKQAYNLMDKWIKQNNITMPAELTVGALLRFTLTECRMSQPYIPEDDHTVGIIK